METLFGFGTGFAALAPWKGKIHMKRNLIPTNKRALLFAVVCAAMFAFSHNASAARTPMPAVQVPDGGATVMLLGAALGVLGLARRFLQ